MHENKQISTVHAIDTMHSDSLDGDNVCDLNGLDSARELRHVGGVNAPVGSRDPVYNFLRC